MAFIGNTNTTQAFTPAIDYFSGNASTTAFTLSRPVASVAQVQAVVNNVAQNPSDAFTVSGNTITFTSAPSSGTNNIYVYYTSPITQVIAPGQGTVNATSLASSTGTGAVVLATSPTLVTPILGAASATSITVAAGAVGTPSITTAGDTNTGIFFSAADTIDFAEGGVATGQFDSSGNFKFNSGYGSVATAYACRAWVNFNGTGTVAIRGSANVSSITDNGTGDYTVNFTTAMPDGNYGFYIGSKQDQAGIGGLAFPTNGTPTGATDGAAGMTTTRIRLRFTNADPSLRDQEVACVSIFR
jgi:hypothetical protein